METEKTGREGKYYVGNCVIYTRTIKEKGGAIKAQMHDCLQIADALHHRIVRIFKNASLESLYGHCFNPGNKIDSVIIAGGECLTRDERYYEAVEAQLVRIGIRLVNADDV